MLEFLKPDGTRVIDKAVSKFTTIIDSLEKGIRLCLAKVTKNETVISQLSDQNTKIDEKAQQAQIFKDNLQKMISENTVTEKKEEKNKEEKDNKDDN